MPGEDFHLSDQTRSQAHPSCGFSRGKPSEHRTAFEMKSEHRCWKTNRTTEARKPVLSSYGPLDKGGLIGIRRFAG